MKLINGKAKLREEKIVFGQINGMYTLRILRDVKAVRIVTRFLSCFLSLFSSFLWNTSGILWFGLLVGILANVITSSMESIP